MKKIYLFLFAAIILISFVSARCLTQSEYAVYQKCIVDQEACRTTFSNCLLNNSLNSCSFENNLPSGPCSICTQEYQTQQNCIAQVQNSPECLAVITIGLGGGICPNNPTPTTSQGGNLPIPPSPTSVAANSYRTIMGKCPNIGIPPIQTVPAQLNLTFPASQDEIGPSIIKANCGNGQTAQAICDSTTCRIICAYPSQESCPNGVCLLKILTCGGQCETNSQTGTTTCSRYSCNVQTDDIWQTCNTGNLQLKERPTGCAYQNPFCQANETCQYNQCIQKECENDSDCGLNDACNTATCSKFKCLKTQTPGCATQNTCAPYGNRNEGKYCDTSRQLLNQKETGTTCQNNYECKTNFCSNNTCLDIAGTVEKQQGIIDQILTFLKQLFGFK